MIFRDDLERVYALLEDEKRWTKDAYARDSNGDKLLDGETMRVCNSPKACAWCLQGAWYKTGGHYGNVNSFEDALGLTSRFGDAALGWNDQHTHAEVLALLRSAIERAPIRP